MEYAWVGTENPYEYNGKELNEDFGVNLFDYGARWYDAALGRWWSVDPLGEKYFDGSLYGYVANNPIGSIDLDGRQIFDQYDKKAEITYDKDKITISNAGKLDGKLVELLINTFLESETGMETVRNLDESKDKYQVIVSDKAGLIESPKNSGDYLVIGGVTTRDRIGYKATMYIFNFEKGANLDPNSVAPDDFDMPALGKGEYAFATEKEKKNVAKKFSKTGNNAVHENTNKAISRLSKQQKEILQEIHTLSVQSRSFGNTYTFIHEAVHALGPRGDHDEFKPRIAEIKSFCQCNPNYDGCK